MHVSDLEPRLIWSLIAPATGGFGLCTTRSAGPSRPVPWNARYGTALGYIGINTVALSPDGRYLFAGTDGGPGGATRSGLLVRIPIQADGSAGKGESLCGRVGANS